MNRTSSAGPRFEHASCEFLLTDRCNLRCDYCIATELPRAQMSVTVGKRAVDLFLHLAHGAHTAEITFTGGEPLMACSVLDDLTDYALSRALDGGVQLHIVVKTNGTLLTTAIIQTLKRSTARLVVSIDGTPAVHDAHRRGTCGRSDHSLVSSHISAFLNEGIDCVASMTVHPDASGGMLEGVRYLHHLGIREIELGPAYGRVTWSEQQCSEFVRGLNDIALYMRSANRAGQQLEVGPLSRKSEHVGEVLRETWGCHAGSSHLAFLPSGEIAGCSALAMIASRFRELILGNVSVGLDQSAVDRFLAAAGAGPADRYRCRRCPSRANCTGGCLAINYSTSGQPLKAPHVYCATMSAIPGAWQTAWASSPT